MRSLYGCGVWPENDPRELSFSWTHINKGTSGIGHFDILLNRAVELAPEHHLVSIEEVGAFAAFFVCNGAKSITAGVHYVEGGYHIVG